MSFGRFSLISPRTDPSTFLFCCLMFCFVCASPLLHVCVSFLSMLLHICFTRFEETAVDAKPSPVEVAIESYKVAGLRGSKVSSLQTQLSTGISVELAAQSVSSHSRTIMEFPEIRNE